MAKKVEIVEQKKEEQQLEENEKGKEKVDDSPVRVTRSGRKIASTPKKSVEVSTEKKK